jgi:hypothetical protein
VHRELVTDRVLPDQQFLEDRLVLPHIVTAVIRTLVPPATKNRRRRAPNDVGSSAAATAGRHRGSCSARRWSSSAAVVYSLVATPSSSRRRLKPSTSASGGVRVGRRTAEEHQKEGSPVDLPEGASLLVLPERPVAQLVPDHEDDNVELLELDRGLEDLDAAADPSTQHLRRVLKLAVQQRRAASAWTSK